MIVQLASGTSGAIIDTAARIAGTAILAGFLAAAVALLYRWYVRERVPAGLALLVGLAGVAVVAGTTSLLAQQLAPGGTDPDALAALLNVVTFVVGGLGAYGGMRTGDALGVDLFAATGGDGIEGDVSEFVKAVGRVIAVEIPDEVGDIVGYDPVPDATKEGLEGRTFLFPRRLTKAELRDRFVARLKTDYGVGHVDVEFDESGAAEYLALGSRAAGIGPTLPPATNAVAIRADPANAASAGDLVQVWETDPMGRVLTGELRGVAGEIVTVAIDAADTPKLDPTTEYKLVTLPVQDRPDRAFASLLRAADETLATITVQSGSRADGLRVDSLGVTVAAITRDDEPPTPLPAEDRAVRGGDVIYAIATPDALRKLEAATEAPDGVVTDDSGPVDTVADDAASPDDQPEVAPDASAEGAIAADADDRHDATDDDDEPADTVASEPDADDDATESDDEQGATEQPGGAEIPDTAAFPDSDDLPGVDPETEAGETTDDETATVSDNEDETGAIPDTAAFPDSDDLPGADVSSTSAVGTSDDAAADDDTTDGDSTADDAADMSRDDETAAESDEETIPSDPADSIDAAGPVADDESDDGGAGFDDLLDDDLTDDDGLDELLNDDDDETDRDST